jgi:hypothetical protein
MPSDDVLLVLNCQQDLSYANRHVLRALYGDRFPELAFAIAATCAPDIAFRNIATAWEPRLRENICCACYDLADGRHPAGIHVTQPRLVEVARAAAAEGFRYVVFADDDCILSPRLDPAEIRHRFAATGAEAIVPSLWFCDRDDDSWLWTRHPTGYPAFDAASARFDRHRLLRHWESFSGTKAPPVLYVPMFGGFVDWLAFRVDFLDRLVPDLLALADLWHETAIPTAILHQTDRISLADGAALWGADRHQPTDALFGLLADRDFVHPIKLRWIGADAALTAYRRLAGGRPGN